MISPAYVTDCFIFPDLEALCTADGAGGGLNVYIVIRKPIRLSLFSMSSGLYFRSLRNQRVNDKNEEWDNMLSDEGKKLRISKKLKRIYIPITIVLCGLLNIGAVCPNTSGCPNPVVDQQKDEELKWNWVVKPGEYEECLFLGDGLIAVKKKSGCYGIVDQSGNFVFPNEYDAIGKYCEGLARVREQEKAFFINRN